MMDNKNKFSEEDRLYYPKGSDNIDIDILNNNTRILDRIKLEARDIENVAKESTPKNIENKVLDTNTKVNSMGDTIAEKLSDVAKHSTVTDIQNKTNGIYNEITNSSASYINGQVQWLYNNYNGIIKNVQWGYRRTAGHYTDTVNHSTVNVNKSFLILNGEFNGEQGQALALKSRSSSSFVVSAGDEYSSGHSAHGFGWQVIEFY